MKPIALSLLSAVVAVVALAATAAPARAGLDFTDTATFQARTPDVTFNGSSTLGTTKTMVNGLNGGNLVTLSSTGTFAPASAATVDFGYTGMTTNGFFGFKYANYDTTVANPGYNMIVQFGTITGTVALNTITFVEAGSSIFTPYSLNQTLTAADSGRRLHIFIPSTGVGSIPLSERDFVQAVRLAFTFSNGSASSVAIQAVANPEPGTIALFGLGLVGLAGAVRARRRSRARAQNA
jgi:hypothetical protein